MAKVTVRLEHNPKAYGAVGDGVANDRQALFDTDAAVPAGGGDYYLSPGTYLVNSNLTLNAKSHLRFANGAILRPANGVTITINGPLDAPLSKIFDLVGTGVIAFGPDVEAFYPEWWGAKGDDSSDDTSALQSALNVFFTTGLAGNRSGAFHLQPSKTYRITSSLVYAGGSSYGIHINGGSSSRQQSAKIKWVGAVGGVPLILWAVNQSTIENVLVDGNGTAKYGIQAASNNAFTSTLGTAVSPGTVVCTPGSMSGIGVGTLLLVDRGTASAEIVRVTATTGTTFTATFAKSHLSSAEIGGGEGGSGCKFMRVSVRGCAGVDSSDIAIGNVSSAGGPSSQMSEIHFEDCVLDGLNVSERGILILTGGNVKNHKFIGGAISSHTKYGVDWIPSSGTMNIIGTALAGQQIADFYFSGGSILLLIGVQSEGASQYRFVDGPGAVGNPGSLVILGCQWEGIAPAADDYVIRTAARLFMAGNNFFNNRTGSSIAKIQMFTSTLSSSWGTIYSEGNFFENAATWAPFYDGSNNVILPAYYANQPVQIRSVGDVGGVDGALTGLNDYITANRITSFGASKVSSVGVLAVGTADVAVGFRNNADSGDIVGLQKDTSDIVQIGDAAGSKSNSHLLIGGSTLLSGTGVPASGLGVNGDIYFRTDGGSGTTIYQKRAGAWVATGA